jgi:hypothetical protein
MTLAALTHAYPALTGPASQNSPQFVDLDGDGTNKIRRSLDSANARS